MRLTRLTQSRKSILRSSQNSRVVPRILITRYREWRHGRIAQLNQERIAQMIVSDQDRNVAKKRIPDEYAQRRPIRKIGTARDDRDTDRPTAFFPGGVPLVGRKRAAAVERRARETSGLSVVSEGDLN